MAVSNNSHCSPILPRVDGLGEPCQLYFTYWTADFACSNTEAIIIIKVATANQIVTTSRLATLMIKEKLVFCILTVTMITIMLNHRQETHMHNKIKAATGVTVTLMAKRKAMVPIVSLAETIYIRDFD